jgi:cysteinyl-tRNA synthetase
VAEATLSPEAQTILAAFDQAVSADLMTPRALPLLEDALARAKAAPEETLRLVATMDLVLGLDLLRLRRADLRVTPAAASLDAAAVEALVADRKAARAERDFARSDAIRDRLLAAGVEIMDGDPLGWDWRVDLEA